MGSCAAGSVLLRHLCPRVSSSSAAAAAHAVPPVAGGGGGEGGVALWARLLSTAAASAKEEAAASKENTGSTAAAKEGARASPVASSYWGIEPSKLVTKDGVEWKWSCFRPWETYSPDTTVDLKKHHEPKVLLDKVAYWTVKALRVPTDIFFQEVRVPRDDAGDGGGGAGDGGRHAAAPPLAPPLRAQWRLDPRAAGGGRERADAPHDLHGGGQAEVVRARARARRPGRLLQRLLPRLPPVPQVRAPRRRLPRGGGRPLLHRVPQGHRGRQDRERPRAADRHRLLAAPRRRHAQGRRRRRPRRRGAPPRRQPFRIGCSFPGDGSQGYACPARLSLMINFQKKIITDEILRRLVPCSALRLLPRNRSCC